MREMIDFCIDARDGEPLYKLPSVWVLRWKDGEIRRCKHYGRISPASAVRVFRAIMSICERNQKGQ